jgi:integrase/recombinase XerD
LRAYRSDFATFEAWCSQTGRSALPATRETIVFYIEEQHEPLAASTLKRRLCGVRKVHRLMDFPNPVDNEHVAIAMRRALRTKRRRPRQALGLNAALRDQLLEVCDDKTLTGARDRAVIALGYDALCRRSELVGLLVEDIRPLADGCAKVLIRRSKCDPFGDGRWAYISQRGYEVLAHWLTTAKIDRGPVLRPVYRGAVVGQGQLNPKVVNRTLKRVAAKAGVEADKVQALSGHSMRVGAAQDLMTQGRELLQIMTAGGWSSVNVVGRYVGNADFNIWS